ncbi:MAG: major capsid protein [Proteobacteria bacterium]|nr:major capsid protein [Pseudomonadota bacterium]
MLAQLRALFAAQAVANHLAALPPVHSTIMDDMFPNRPTHPFALLGLEELVEVLKEIPVITRGGRSIPIGGEGVGVSFIEPLPVKPSRDITGQDLNNLKMILGNRASLEVWVRGRIDSLRRACRATTEAIAATAITGKISWPVKLDGGGWDVYEVDFGAPLTFVAPKKLDVEGVTLADAYKILSGMRTSIQNAGMGGGDIGFLAGQNAFAAILTVAENIKTTAKHNIRIEIKNGTVDVGGFVVKECAETYRDPKEGTFVKKVPDHKIVAYAKDTPGSVFYCALDDIDNNLRAMPFLSRVDKLPEGTGVKVIGHSKPMPARSPKTICWCEVVAA